ncbi:hypothetical protein ASH02_19320 [Nocardioides sp. Soil796]|nr:hypothetical protein ASH02_19320 [Nocardioides sp. Soil796]
MYPVLVALVVTAVSCVGSGLALLATRRSRLAAGLLVLGGVTLAAATLVSGTGDARPAEQLAELLFAAAAGLLLPLAIITYPRVEWRHPVDFAALVGVAGAGLLITVQPGASDAQGVLEFTAGCILIAHTWWRIERADAAARRPLVWMALALGVAGLGCGVLVFTADGGQGSASDVVVAVGVALWAIVAPAMYVGVARPEFMDVRALVVRVAVVAVAVVCYLCVFVGTVSFLDLLGGPGLPSSPSPGVLGVIGALAALTVHPLQVVLRGVVDELLFGRRPDPLDAASQVAGRLGDDPVVALQAVREAMVLPYAAIRVDGVDVAVSGTPVTHVHALPLAFSGSTAVLAVGLRPGDLALGRGDAHVLELVAALLSQTLHVRALADELRLSREGTVTALAEERRRLRRDLHDGLGPRLSGIAFTSDAVRNTLRSQPDRAEELLTTLRTETVAAITEIRQLVYAMRPPALDELGLVGALRQAATAMRTPEGGPVQVRIEAAGLPPLSAAVEVAAYRIVAEALTNVARHSGHHRAHVRLASDGRQLEIDVLGEGLAADRACAWTPGVGMASMRERAAELGGTVTAGPGPSGGRVHAVLPLPGGG